MPDMETLRRVQVKYRADMGVGALKVEFRSNYYDSKKIYSKRVDLQEIDCYAIYCPDTDGVYYLRVNEIPENGGAVTLRFKPTKSGRKKDIWVAEDFIDPNRIGLNTKMLNNFRREVSEADEIAIDHVITNLMEKGVQPLIPQSQYVPFDLVGVMSDMKTMQRVRVGYTQVRLSPYVDQYAIYLPDQTIVRYFRPDEIRENEQFITTVG